MSDPRWYWRNCRDVGISVDMWPFNWSIGADIKADVYGGVAYLNIGPIGFRLSYSIGNCSAECGLQRWIGLSENKAYERACRYEGIYTEAAEGGEDGQ